MDGYTPSARDICQRHFSDEGDNVVDWDQYDEDRPVYPLATLEYIIAYHKRHNAEADSANYRADGPRTGGHMEHAVDVGCGPGTLLPTLLAPHFLRGTLVDVHATQLRMAKRRFDSLRAATPDMPLQQLITVQASGEDLPLDDACADMVTSAEAVHWMDWGRFLAEAHRVLKPGGTIAVLFYAPVPRFTDKEASALLEDIEQHFFETYLRPQLSTLLSPSARRLIASSFDELDLKRAGFVREERIHSDDWPEYVRRHAGAYKDNRDHVHGTFASTHGCPHRLPKTVTSIDDFDRMMNSLGYWTAAIEGDAQSVSSSTTAPRWSVLRKALVDILARRTPLTAYFPFYAVLGSKPQSSP